jgi:hypothetical protein
MPLFSPELKNMTYYKLTGMSQGHEGGLIPIELLPVAN